MAYFKHTDKLLQELPDVTKPKKLSNLLYTNSLLRKIRTLGTNEIANFRMGALGLSLTFFTMGYYFYRQSYRQRMMSSASYYKFTECSAIDVNKQFWYNDISEDTTEQFTYFYRMPKKEFDIKYRMRSAFIKGEFDHEKEILIPAKNEYGMTGYDVFTPFYYYYKKSKSQYLDVLQDGTVTEGKNVERAAIPVHRGWYLFIYIFII